MSRIAEMERELSRMVNDAEKRAASVPWYLRKRVTAEARNLAEARDAVSRCNIWFSFE